MSVIRKFMDTKAKTNFKNMLCHSLFLTNLAFVIMGSLFFGVSRLDFLSSSGFGVALPLNVTSLFFFTACSLVAIVRKQSVLLLFSMVTLVIILCLSSPLISNNFITNYNMPSLQLASWLLVITGLWARFKENNPILDKMSSACFVLLATIMLMLLFVNKGTLERFEFASNPTEALNTAIFMLFIAIAGLTSSVTFRFSIDDYVHSLGGGLALLLITSTLLLRLNYIHQLEFANQKIAQETALKFKQQIKQTLEVQNGLMLRLANRLTAPTFAYQPQQMNLDINTYLRDFNYLDYLAILTLKDDVYYSAGQTANIKQWYDNYTTAKLIKVLSNQNVKTESVPYFYYDDVQQHTFISLYLPQPNSANVSRVIAGINFKKIMQASLPIIVPSGYAVIVEYGANGQPLLSQLDPKRQYFFLSGYTIDSGTQLNWRVRVYKDVDITVNYERLVSEAILIAGWFACLLALLMQQYQQQFQWQHKKLTTANNNLTKSLEQQKKLQTHHLQFMENSADLLCIISSEGEFIEVSRSSYSILGYTPDELMGQKFMNFVYPEDCELTECEAEMVMAGQYTQYFRNRYVKKSGEIVHLMWSARFMSSMQTMYAVARDISELVKAERYQKAQQQILELTSLDAPLDEILEQICVMAEAHNPALKACVMLKEEQHLIIASAPSMSEQYHQDLGRVLVAPNAGTCGSAAFHNKLVISEDIASAPDWQAYLDTILAEQVYACWSLPMVVKHNNVLGTFALYCKETKAPSSEELELLRSCCRFAANAIERAQQKRLVSESEQRFRSLYQFNPDPVYVMNQDGFFTDMNIPGCELLQRPLSELKKMHFAEVLSTEQISKVNTYFFSALSGNSESFETTITSQSGTKYDLQITIIPTWIDDKIVGVIGIAKDITQRLQTQRQLKLFKRAVDASSNGVVIADITQPDMPISYVNNGFEKITGYVQDEITGKNCRFLQGKEPNEVTIKQIREAIASKQEVSVILKNYRKDGSGFWNNLFLSPVPDDEGVITHYIGIQTDITEQKNYERELAFNASHDLLTGLPNRGLLRDRLSQSVKISSRHKEQVAVLFIDLDGFKLINDSLGHLIGDEVICKVSARINRLIRTGDTLARIGGDEFVLMLPDLYELDQTNIMAERVLKTVSEPLKIAGKELQLTASIGISLSDNELHDPMDLVKRADLAMFRAKQLGRNNFQWYNPDMEKTLNKRLSFRAMLKQAFANQEFELYYQPQVSADNGRLTGLEALLRWEHPELGFIGPDEFIPIAEEMGLIVEIGHWVIEQAANYNRSLQQRGLAEVVMAVNLSSLQFQRAGFVEQLEATLNKAKLAAKWFELELTESLLLENIEQVVDKLYHLKKLGISIAIDDFGTGYSSLNYLKRLPIDKLKIDKSFIRELDIDQKDAAITRAIIAMGQQLGLQVIAEGVETLSQANLLSQYGCNELQGYFYAKPLPAAKLEQFIKQYSGNSISRGDDKPNIPQL